MCSGLALAFHGGLDPPSLSFGAGQDFVTNSASRCGGNDVQAENRMRRDRYLPLVSILAAAKTSVTERIALGGGKRSVSHVAQAGLRIGYPRMTLN